jgi:hypothetical protein
MLTGVLVILGGVGGLTGFGVGRARASGSFGGGGSVRRRHFAIPHLRVEIWGPRGGGQG